MSKKKLKPRDLGGHLTWIACGIVFIVIVITAGVSWMLYEHTVGLLTDNLRQRLLSIGITQAANIDYRDIEVLQTEEDWQKPEWTRVVSQMERAKNNNSDIVFMYIFRKTKNDPTQMEFVADAGSINPYANKDDDLNNDVDANGDGIIDPDGADKLQWPGQPYPEAVEIPETFEAYKGPMTARDLYEDSYGKVLTGYAPIKDRNGKIIAILATDIKADDFFTVNRQTLYPFLFFIVFLIIAISILALILVRIWNSRLEMMKELDRQKDELLGLVSHQLATPVSSMKWYLEMLSDGDMGALTKEQKEHVIAMRGIGGNMSDLVGMILDVSRIQLGKMHIEKQDLDLNVFFHDLCAIIEPKAIEKGVKFVKNVPKKLPVAQLDRRYTNMTIENLLSNAVKYTPSGGTVNFDVVLEQNELLVTVTDTGMGIPKAEQDKIFGRMFRASNARNAVDGNGFGLFVAKGAVEAQGGKIWFESTEGKGTTFSVRLPIR